MRAPNSHSGGLKHHHGFKLVQAKRLERAVEAGEDTRLILPHPDDIVIDDDYGYHLAGPVDEAELRKVEQTVSYRDAPIMQTVLDNRLAARQASQTDKPDRSEQSGALLFASVLDSTLPARFRLDDIEIIRRQMRYESINLRQLLKEVYRAWQGAGVPVKRDARFADLATSQRSLGLVFELYQAFREGRGEFDEVAREIMDRLSMTFGLGSPTPQPNEDCWS